MIFSSRAEILKLGCCVQKYSTWSVSCRNIGIGQVSLPVTQSCGAGYLDLTKPNFSELVSLVSVSYSVVQKRCFFGVNAQILLDLCRNILPWDNASRDSCTGPCFKVRA